MNPPRGVNHNGPSARKRSSYCIEGDPLDA